MGFSDSGQLFEKKLNNLVEIPMGKRERNGEFLRKSVNTILIGFLLLLIMSVTQNCSRTLFRAFSIDGMTAKQSPGGGNGGNYDGKVLIFIAYEPGFSCENKFAPKASLVRDQNKKWTFTENQPDQCGATLNEIVTDVDYAEGQNFLKYRSMDFALDPLAPIDNPTLTQYLKIFNVSSAGDQNTPDLVLADGICADAFGRCSLRAAVDEVNSKPETAQIIYLSPGTYAISSLLKFQSKSFVALIGEDPLTTTINGGVDDGILETPFWANPALGLGPTTIIKNLSLNFGRSSVLGQATGIKVEGSVFVKNCEFKNHTASVAAAVIDAGPSAQHILIEDSSISSNQAAGVRVFSPESLTVVRSTISSNNLWGIHVLPSSRNIQIVSSSIVFNGMWGVLLDNCQSNCAISKSNISYNNSSGLDIRSMSGIKIDDLTVSDTSMSNNVPENIRLDVSNSMDSRLILRNNSLSQDLVSNVNCSRLPSNTMTIQMIIENPWSGTTDSSCN